MINMINSLIILIFLNCLSLLRFYRTVYKNIPYSTIRE
nr:MAG TPA: hypothetical protein [Caudoviricetes sp.]